MTVAPLRGQAGKPGSEARSLSVQTQSLAEGSAAVQSGHTVTHPARGVLPPAWGGEDMEWRRFRKGSDI